MNDVLLLLFKDIKYVAIIFFNLNHILTDESISMVFAVILSFVFSNSANIVHSENLTSPFCHQIGGYTAFKECSKLQDGYTVFETVI